LEKFEGKRASARKIVGGNVLKRGLQGVNEGDGDGSCTVRRREGGLRKGKPKRGSARKLKKPAMQGKEGFK